MSVFSLGGSPEARFLSRLVKQWSDVFVLWWTGAADFDVLMSDDVWSSSLSL